ncbi:MAG TPA: hypothetical protein VK598_06665, partial [Nitrospiraceae bacterium]|nr:hypothetical protein [Nitrospiraceae bacterium]
MSTVVHAIEKTVLEPRAIEMTPDEHESTLARLRRWPGSAWFCVQQHVHAVKIELPCLAREIQHPFHAHEVLALLLNQLIDPAIKAVWVKRLAGLNGAGGNGIIVFMVMLVLQNAWFDRQHMRQRKPGYAKQHIGGYLGVRSSKDGRE